MLFLLWLLSPRITINFNFNDIYYFLISSRKNKKWTKVTPYYVPSIKYHSKTIDVWHKHIESQLECYNDDGDDDVSLPPV